MKFFKEILDLIVPDKFGDNPGDNDSLKEREDSVYWDLKFKAASITHEKTVAQRYYALFIPSCLKLIERRRTNYISDKTLYNCMECLRASL
jgi:hypothetical protein